VYLAIELGSRTWRARSSAIPFQTLRCSCIVTVRSTQHCYSTVEQPEART
jgi:hypothetical protein